VKLRFLLFLRVEPTFYLRRSRVQPHETYNPPQISRRQIPPAASQYPTSVVMPSSMPIEPS